MIKLKGLSTTNFRIEGMFDFQRDSSDEEQEVALSGTYRQGKKSKVCLINVICASRTTC